MTDTNDTNELRAPTEETCVPEPAPVEEPLPESDTTDASEPETVAPEADTAEPLPLTAPEKGRGTVTLVVILTLVAVFVGMAACTLLFVWGMGLLEPWLNESLASLGG